MIRHGNIVGKRFGFEYSSETYEFEVLSESELKWTRVAGENTGQGDTEKYVFSKLADDLIMLTWIEADGLGLSNVINFSEGTVVTHANINRDVFENPGKLLPL